MHEQLVQEMVDRDGEYLKWITGAQSGMSLIRLSEGQGSTDRNRSQVAGDSADDGLTL